MTAAAAIVSEKTNPTPNRCSLPSCIITYRQSSVQVLASLSTVGVIVAGKNFFGTMNPSTSFTKNQSGSQTSCLTAASRWFGPRNF